MLCRGSLNSACGYWKKAARGNEALAMYKLGVHFYKGDVHALGRSAEDAAYWLKKFIKCEECQVYIMLRATHSYRPTAQVHARAASGPLCTCLPRPGDRGATVSNC
jgi:hypothetical protein